MKKAIILVLIFVVISFSAFSQIGRLLNKAKQVANEIPTANTQKATQPVSSPTSSDTYNSGSNKEVKSFKTTSAKTSIGKIIFSSKPFAALDASNGERAFKSNQLIYGQLQLNTGTIRSIFKLPAKSNEYPLPSIDYMVEISKGDKVTSSRSVLWTSCVLTEEDAERNYLNFDVLPDPLKSTTVISALPDMSGGKGGAPMYRSINQNTFSENGTYTVEIIFTNYEIKDAWGNKLSKDKCPVISNVFDFEFNEDDISAILTNQKKANDIAKANYAKFVPIPKVWSAKSNPVNIGYSQQMIEKAYLSALGYWGNDVKIIKFYASPESGSTIIKDNIGLPERKSYNQQYLIFAKKASTNECFYQDIYVFNQYSGGGTFHKGLTIGMYDHVLVSCEKLK